MSLHSPDPNYPFIAATVNLRLTALFTIDPVNPFKDACYHFHHHWDRLSSSFRFHPEVITTIKVDFECLIWH